MRQGSNLTSEGGARTLRDRDDSRPPGPKALRVMRRISGDATAGVVTTGPGEDGWGGRIRTSVCGSQSPVPYCLATPHQRTGFSSRTAPWTSRRGESCWPREQRVGKAARSLSGAWRARQPRSGRASSVPGAASRATGRPGDAVERWVPKAAGGGSRVGSPRLSASRRAVPRCCAADEPTGWPIPGCTPPSPFPSGTYG